MQTDLYRFLIERMNTYSDSYISDTMGTRWSYAEFLNQTEAFAEKLTDHKYGVCCSSESLMALSLMACIRAGVTAVPISARYGDSPKKRIIDTCGLSYILTDTSGNLTVEYVGQVVPEEENLSDVALIMCTSGTTGTPKAAMLTGENILANLLDIEQYFPISRADRILISRSLCHAAVLTGEFLIALSKGADIVFGEPEFDPVRTLVQTKEWGATVLCGTPTFFYHYCRFSLRYPESMMLRMIAVSGECMTEKTASLIHKALPNVSVYHVYGLTEAAPRVSWLPPECFIKKPLSAGIPLNSVQIKITDMKGNLVPSGMTGELWISGPNIMKGYYNNRVATAAILQNNWLKTGDIAYLDDEGHLVICGRQDDLIIRAGLNIYPAEIENQLLGEDAIAEVLVYGLKEESGQKIVFYVVPASSQVTSEAIFSMCRAKLPPQHWPNEIVVTHRLPKSISGKLQRH